MTIIVNQTLWTDFFFLQEGDRVYVCGSLTGTYAEFALCNASSIHLMPDSVSFSQGAAIYVPYFTAYRALFQRWGDVNDINDKNRKVNCHCVASVDNCQTYMLQCSACIDEIMGGCPQYFCYNVRLQLTETPFSVIWWGHMTWCCKTLFVTPWQE